MLWKVAGVSAGCFLRTTSQGHRNRQFQKCWEVKQVRQKASLDDQGSSLGAKARKEGVWPVEAKSGDIGGIQTCCCHCREKIHVAKTQLGLKQVRNVGDNKKSFFKYVSAKAVQK